MSKWQGTVSCCWQYIAVFADVCIIAAVIAACASAMWWVWEWFARRVLGG